MCVSSKELVRANMGNIYKKSGIIRFECKPVLYSSYLPS